ncbi:hypothetical protein [Sphingomonas sp. GC_Shp_6]|uniref:hypothetical protein n=2 Tax=unclassified Sphingomonas TaxID=196159 RepID=UPI0022698E73|nr:hypothetical protein [Sphingomonas sp. GC_Shp_6]
MSTAPPQSPVARRRRHAYPRLMADEISDDPHSAAARVDAAIARIEGAIAARAASADALARRHDALKARMAEAVAALDDVIARGSTG